MITPSLTILLTIMSTASAQMLARRVAQVLPERGVRLTGGWSLHAEDTKFCPNDLSICGSDTLCCPTSLTCQYAGAPSNLCCASSESCLSTFEATPYCADDSWSLWDVTQGGINSSGYFCCASGLVGLLSGKCVNPNTVTSPSLEALAVMPGGGLLSASTQTVVVQSTTAVVSSVTVTSVQTTVSTSTATSVAVGKVTSSSVKPSSVTATTATVIGTTTAIAVSASSTSSSDNSASSSAAASATKSSSAGVGLVGFQIGALALAGGAYFLAAAL